MGAFKMCSRKGAKVALGFLLDQIVGTKIHREQIWKRIRELYPNQYGGPYSKGDILCGV